MKVLNCISIHLFNCMVTYKTENEKLGGKIRAAYVTADMLLIHSYLKPEGLFSHFPRNQPVWPKLAWLAPLTLPHCK